MILCVVCKVNESTVQNGPGAPLCRTCRAEIVLTNEDPNLAIKTVDALFSAEDGKVTLNAQIKDNVSGVMARAVKCERCGRASVYDPLKAKQSFYCDECGKQLCTGCGALCFHKDFTAPKILCTDCRAEKSLTGQPVEETVVDLPGDKKREPKPHCGRASCIGEPGDVDPWCLCECAKCKTAVAAGFPKPMFGQMTPDPDPVPEAEPAESSCDNDGEDEEEIAKWEGGQQ